jgi:hypothetical protein
MAEHEIFSSATQSEFLIVAQRYGCTISFLDTPENRDLEGNPIISVEREGLTGTTRLFLLPDLGDDAQLDRAFLTKAFALLFQEPATR